MLRPKAKAYVFRTAMIGGGLSYDVLVPIKDIHNYDGTRYTTICRDGQTDKRFLDYTDATMPEEHYAMEKGWDRYEAYLAHEKRAKIEAMKLARQAFPELNAYDGDSLPDLWCVGLPVEEETHATAIVRL